MQFGDIESILHREVVYFSEGSQVNNIIVINYENL